MFKCSWFPNRHNIRFIRINNRIIRNIIGSTLSIITSSIKAGSTLSTIAGSILTGSIIAGSIIAGST